MNVTLPSTVDTASAYSDDEVEMLYAAAHRLTLGGDLSSAEWVLTHVCDQRPRALRYLQALAQIRRDLGDLEAAARLFDYIEQLDPGQITHWVDLADCWLRMHSPPAQAAARELLALTLEFARQMQRTGPDVERARALLRLLAAAEPASLPSPSSPSSPSSLEPPDAVHPTGP